MKTEQKEEQKELNIEVDIHGRSWVFQGDPEKAEGLANWVDALVMKYSEGKEYKVDVTMTDPEYKSWSFYVSDEDYPELEDKLDQKEEEF